ncbi:hypothetical protein HY971_03285 [Candidatus Kaiserbacteria bacterium]|nr:hypothetical protein [Candidatus Kaiserbacteria bacterium]
MADKWVGVFTLAVLIGFISYVESSSLMSREFAVSAPAMLAQTAAPTNVAAPVYELCPAESATQKYYPTIIQSAKFPAQIRGQTNLYGKSCSYKKKNENGPGEIFVRSECRGPKDCRALEYEDENGVVKPVTSPTDGKKYDSVGCVSGIFSTCLQAGYDPTANQSGQPYVPYTGTPIEPGKLPDSSNPLKEPSQPVTGGTQIPKDVYPPATSGGTGPSTERIRAASSGSGSTPPTQTAPQQQYFNQNNPALYQQQGLNPSYNPTGGTGGLGGGYPGYSAGLGYSPTTFPGQYSSPTYQGRPPKYSGNGFVSVIGSFFSGLFSVQPNPVTTFVTSFTNASQQPTGNPSQNPQQRIVQGPGGQTYVILMPQQSGPDVDEVNRRIIAIATQGRRVPQGSVPLTDIPGIATSGPASPIGPAYSVTTVGLEAAFSETESLKPTPRKATSTTTTASSTPWNDGRKVVEVGTPVDIAGPAGIAAIIAAFNGSWTPRSNTSFGDSAALAQAKSDFESAVAQIAALQEARSAGLCDVTCDSSLASLESELSMRQMNIDALDAIVQKNESALPDLPAPTIQISRIVNDYVRSQEQSTAVSLAALNSDTADPPNAQRGAPDRSATQSGSDTSAQNSAGSPTSVGIATQEESASTPSEATGENVVVRIVSGIWSALKSFFSPNTTSATSTPQNYCSLFSRIFGGCK